MSYSQWGHKELDMTQRLNNNNVWFVTRVFGEGTDAQAQLPGFKSSSATSCRVTLGQLLDVSVLQLPTLQNED